MDYEKAYKAVLKTATQWIKDGCTDKERICLESVFPELRESEDERIRRFLKDYAIEMIAGLESDISISVYDGVKGHDPDAEAELEKWRGARAWLEKQREKSEKPIFPESEDERIRKEIVNFILYKSGHLLDEETEHRFVSYLEKHKEPIDPFDTKLFQDGVKEGRRLEREDIKKEQKPMSILTKDDSTFTAYCKGQNDVIENPEAYGLCKPAEWSEEDERMLSRCVKSIESSKQFADADTFKKAKDKEIDWLTKRLKFVHPQPMQEWSEEDEQWLECIIKDYEDSLTKDKDHAAVIKVKIDFLKSLRIHWKPSEEQPQVADASKMEQEVDLEKEIDKGIADYSFTKTIDLGGFKTTVIDYAKIARHFYELGKNSK